MLYYEFDTANQSLEPMKNGFAEKIEPFKESFVTIITSPDNSKVLFAYPPKGKDKKDKANSYRMILQDGQGNKLWEKEMRTNLFFNAARFFKHSFALDNDGTVYVAGIKFYSDKNKSMKRENFDYIIEKMTNETAENKQFKITMNGLYYHNVKIGVTQNNKLFAVQTK